MRKGLIFIFSSTLTFLLIFHPRLFATDQLTLNEIHKNWETFNLKTTLDYGAHKAISATFLTVTAPADIDVYDFNDGKTKVGTINKGSDYLVFAITRFLLNKTDKSWALFCVVKYKLDALRFWDGIISIDQSQFHSFAKSLLFLNCQYHSNNRSLAEILDGSYQNTTVYLFDNTVYEVKRIQGNVIPDSELQKFTKHRYGFLSFDYTTEKQTEIFEFAVGNEQIDLGSLIWDSSKNEISLELKKPVNPITGDPISE